MLWHVGNEDNVCIKLLIKFLQFIAQRSIANDYKSDIHLILHTGCRLDDYLQPLRVSKDAGIHEYLLTFESMLLAPSAVGADTRDNIFIDAVRQPEHGDFRETPDDVADDSLRLTSRGYSLNRKM